MAANEAEMERNLQVLETEISELREWKAGAMRVLNEIDELRQLNVAPWGSSLIAGAVKTITELRKPTDADMFLWAVSRGDIRMATGTSSWFARFWSREHLFERDRHSVVKLDDVTRSWIKGNRDFQEWFKEQFRHG